MNLTAYPVQIQTLKFIDMGISILMHWMQAVVSVPPLLESKDLRMVPIGARLIIFLVKLQQL